MLKIIGTHKSPLKIISSLCLGYCMIFSNLSSISIYVYTSVVMPLFPQVHNILHGNVSRTFNGKIIQRAFIFKIPGKETEFNWHVKRTQKNCESNPFDYSTFFTLFYYWK